MVQIGPEIAGYTCLCVQDGGHLGFVLPQFWTTHDVPLDGVNFPC